MTIERLAYWWHRLTSSRYVLSLEARIAQLEADNLALRNTVFGLRGLPPVNGIQHFSSTTAAPDRPQPAPAEMRPKVEAIFRDRRANAERVAKAQAEEIKARKKLIEDAREEFGAEVKKWRAQRSGTGLVVPQGASDPVEVTEPPVEPPAEEVG